jgi:phage portal protein BeeE
MASLRDLIFKSAEERRQAKMVPSRAYEAMIWGKGWEDYTRWDKKKLIEQGFERNAPFYSAAMLLSRTVASMPIYIDAKKSGRSVSTDNHPIISLMNRNMPMDQFIQMVTLWLITTG